MARLTFTLPTGEQQSFTLYSDRRIRIGRERNNEISLRDARISRTHAELTFERGFYVIRDLGSANGTWVNGKQIKVAPLTDGAVVKMGASTGTFSEELDQDTPPRFSDSGIADQPATRETPWPPGKVPEPVSGESGVTKPNPKGNPDELDPEYYDQLPTAEIPDERNRKERDTSIIPSSTSKYEIRVPEPHESGRINEENGRAVLYFRSAWNLAALVAPIVASVMVVCGFFAVLSLLLQGRFVPAVCAAGLTSVFAWAVLTLAPRKLVEFFRDELLDETWFRLSQESPAFPRLVYRAQDASGNVIAWFVSPALSRSWEARSSISGPPFAELRREYSSVLQAVADLLGLPVARLWTLIDQSTSRGRLETRHSLATLSISGNEASDDDLRIPLSFAVLSLVAR